jgi:hypothetical protein
LSALYVLTKNENVNKIMREVCNEVNQTYSKSKVADNRQESFKGFDFIKEKHNEMKSALKANPNATTFVNYLLVTIMGGVIQGLPPRRLLDYAEMKVKGYDKAVDNFYDKKIFGFNKYKTANSVKRNSGSTLQTVEVPAEVKKVINKWLKINTSDYLFVNPNTNQKFTSSTLNKYLYKLFGSKISVDQLRAFYSTNKFQDLPSFEKLQEDAEAMGTSLGSILKHYAKKD